MRERGEELVLQPVGLLLALEQIGALSLRGFNLVEHAIERLHQQADLVLGGGLGAQGVVAAIGDLPRGAGQRRNRPRHNPLQRERQQEGQQQAADENRGDRRTLGLQARGGRLEIAHEQDLAPGAAAPGQLLDHFEPCAGKARARRDRRRAGRLCRRIVESHLGEQRPGA